MKSNIFFLMGFLHLSQADLTEKIQEIRTLSNALPSLSVLDFGSHCSPKAEDEQNKLISEMLQVIQIENEFILDEFSSRMSRFIQDNSARGLCNTKKLLACDSDNAICDCGPKDENFNYTREYGKCRLAIGSECIPNELLVHRVLDIKCARGSHCVTKFNLKDCSMLNVIADYNLKNQKITSDSDLCYCTRNLDLDLDASSSSSSALIFSINTSTTICIVSSFILLLFRK